MTPQLLTADRLHVCDVCSNAVFRGERYYEHRTVPTLTEPLRECASCADQAGRWT